MTNYDWLILGFVISTPVLGVIFGAMFAKMMLRRQKKVEQAWEEFQEKRKRLYDKLADPQSIEAEMEQRATLRDAHLYEERRTLPREDAGPAAKVYRPPLRNVNPASWRARNPREDE